MKITDRYYGYPILTQNDSDIAGNFNIKVDTYKDEIRQLLKLKITVDMDNSDINSLIEKDMAIFSIHMEESKTCFREVLQTKSNITNYEIPFGKIRESIDICGFITTTKQVNNFKSSTIDEFYNDIEVNYDAFQIIGVSESQNIEITKEQDQVNDSESIFSIIKNTDTKINIIKYALEENRIVIELPLSNFNTYQALISFNRVVNITKDILLSNIVMPIMVEVFETLKENYSNYEDAIWFKSIIKTFEDLNIDFMKKLETKDFKSYEYAQIIFKSIIGKSLDQVEKLVNSRGTE